MKTKGKYILDENGDPKEVFDLMEWANWMETGHRHVALDVVGDYNVSTVFLGLDYNFSKRPNPILFETAVFSKDDEEDTHEYFNRFETKEDAKIWHENVVRELKEKIKEQ